MKRLEVEELLSKVIQELPRFCSTFEREFAVYWKKQEVEFYGRNFWYFYVYDENGNEVSVENLETECYSLVIHWFDPDNKDTLKIGLLDSEQLNVEKIKQWFLDAKETILLQHGKDFLYEYWKDQQKMYNWNSKVLEHTIWIRKKLMEYESALMEPDMNIVNYLRKEIQQKMLDFDKTFQDHFEIK